MDIFEYAMKMEQDGRAYYLEHAEKASLPELKKILLELADDELKHYEIFKAMRDGETPAASDTTTTILQTVKNVFQTLREQEQDFQFPENARDVWVHAREIERKSEEFYREKAQEVPDARQREVLERIAEEEHRHWVTMQSVIQFLDRPGQWLEDAEWSGLDDY